jgi:hypothetical protein
MRVAGEFNRRSAPVASRAASRAQGSRARSIAAGDPSDADCHRSAASFIGYDAKIFFDYGAKLW